jgi:signal transduction histidine kinase
VLLGAAALWLTASGPLAGVRVRFAVPAILTALIISFNVLLVARLMFLSDADSLLVLDILLFSVVVGVALSSSVSGAVATAIRRVEAGARRVAGGDYGFRLPPGDVSGANELVRLGAWFNQMAASVEDAFTRQRRAERERRQVIAALSHDLRTPLASIRALIEAVTDGVVTDPAMVARYQRTIGMEVRHLSVLIDDLFELARLEAISPGRPGPQLELVALDDLISDLLEAMSAQAAQRGIRLSGEVAGELPPVHVDARQMHRLLANLVQNALAHTPPGGRVTVHASVRASAPDDAHRHARGDARGDPLAHPSGGPTAAPVVLVRVLDTGEGIPASDLPNIFAPMYRGVPDPRPPLAAGAGLGLAIARGVVEAHGGQIWAESPLPPASLTLLGAPALERDRDTGPARAIDPLQGDPAPGDPAPGDPAVGAASGTCISFTLPVQRHPTP